MEIGNKVNRAKVNQHMKITTSKRDLTKDIQTCVKGKIIDLSSASEYWRKCVEAVLPHIQALIRKRGPNRYELANDQFFGFFFNHLQGRIARYKARPPETIVMKMNSAELIAEALYNAAQLFGKPLIEVPKDWDSLWPKDRPMSEAWERLGVPESMTIPGGAAQIWTPRSMGMRARLEDPGQSSELRLLRPGQSSYPRIGLSLTYHKDPQELPKITIEIEGEPVCVLMKAHYNLKDSKERSRVRSDAKRVWSSLFRWITPWQAKAGRPREDRGKEAAQLHYHQGLTWTQVADRLCPQKSLHLRPNRQNHIHRCKENFRKQAEQFFRKITQHIKTLPAAKV
ncbi:MAG: hypothetical protein A3F68_06855 [Acidobacteria bacterium RIFCSPLOWO2_12_FULL_54_10]|nr:MAG: hypothetical protein A3F68_06855 [Acidobacteria bacterium RIFCSPLOWO2_12_FULL_54_10]